MFRQFAIIIGCLAVGELIVWLTNIPIPSSILGMLLLTALLQTKGDAQHLSDQEYGLFLCSTGCGADALFRHHKG